MHKYGKKKGKQILSPPSNIDGTLIRNIRDISHTMRSLFEGRGSQKRVLIVLLETGPITQRALTQRLGIQPGSASEVLSKLENAGLICRTASENDRRTTDISLTEDGRQQAAIAKEQRDRRHQEMFSCLSSGEKQELLALLERINGDWQRRYGAPAAGDRPFREGQPERRP